MKDAHYGKLTPQERLPLTIEALARGDDVEAHRLMSTCPTRNYTMHDIDYSMMLTRLKTIALMALMAAYQANSRANAALAAMVMDNHRALPAYLLYKSTQFSVWEAWKRFCSSIDLGADAVFTALKLDCPELDDPTQDDDVRADEDTVAMFYGSFRESWKSPL